MKTIELVQKADADNFVRLAIPVEDPAGTYRVIVLFEQAGTEARGEGLEQWPPGFFERTAGRWVGDLERAPQGDYEQRATL